MKIYIWKTSLRGNNCVSQRISWNLFQYTGGQRRITGKSGRRPSTTACPGCWAMGTNKVKKCAVRKIIFCIGLTRTAKAGQKIYRTGTTSPANQPRKNHFYLYSKSPHLYLFRQSAVATPLWSLWFCPCWLRRWWGQWLKSGEERCLCTPCCGQVSYRLKLGS